MKFYSTSGKHETDLVGAIHNGLAPDGCLYIPEFLPKFNPNDIGGTSVAEIANQILYPFFKNSSLEVDLEDICHESLNFPIINNELKHSNNISLLELYHGPTAAFKDVGARFLASTMDRYLARKTYGSEVTTILVATSGDTGGAVAAAFYNRKNIRAMIFFPKEQVSPRQKHQLTCWDKNIKSFEVDGTFDDCQFLVKSAFNDKNLNKKHTLSAANSINIGRLLPQAAYHAAASIWNWRNYEKPSNFIIPTGNLGNALGCIWAKHMGMPIERIILAVNANQSIPDYLSTGNWLPRQSINTLASAMDVGNPSNMERLRFLIPSFQDLSNTIESFSVNDEMIKSEIKKVYLNNDIIICPHTATAFSTYEHLADNNDDGCPFIIDATAHAAKFNNIIEPIIGREVDIPSSLRDLLKRKTNYNSLSKKLDDLVKQLEKWD
tara:strand:- start:5302 stop:6609 length:1308 start_codon:yes stop_codon:yes gene_type:complete